MPESEERFDRSFPRILAHRRPSAVVAATGAQSAPASRSYKPRRNHPQSRSGAGASRDPLVLWASDCCTLALDSMRSFTLGERS
jgi:hypothetical protein